MSLMSDFLYLFLLDPSRLFAENKQYDAYEKEEPGYGLSLLRAYQYAWCQNLQGGLSHELLQGIHAQVLQHKPMGVAYDGIHALKLRQQTPSKPGQYKLVCNNFSIYATAVDNPKMCNANASIEGFIEFVQSSCLSDGPKVHSIVFSNPKNDIKRSLDTSFEVIPTLKGMILKTPHDQLPGFGPSRVTNYDPACDIKRFEFALTHSGMGANISEIRQRAEPFYICEINSMPDDLVPPAEIREMTRRCLDRIFESYATAMKLALTDDEKLTVIVKHVQQISQLHPWEDGNIRVCYVLLNRLLKEANLDLTLLYNPNRFDAFSVRELVESVKVGQRRCSALLLEEKIPSFCDDSELDAALKAGLPMRAIRPHPLALRDPAVTSFVDILQTEQQLLRFKSPETSPSRPLATEAGISFFAGSLTEHQAVWMKNLTEYITRYPQYSSFLKALETRQFGLALRKAASVPDVFLTAMTLNFIRNQSDCVAIVNEASSSTGKKAIDFALGCPDSLNKMQVMSLLTQFAAKLEIEKPMVEQTLLAS